LNARLATTGATDKQVKASEDYISKLSAATGVTDDEMRPALEKLAAASGSAEKGQAQLGEAVDIAAAAHVDLAVAAKAVTQADQGRLGALNKLVPGIDAATIKSKDSTAALEEAAKLTDGAAADAAKTYGGQMKVMSTQIGEAKEAIGAGFLPILQKLLPVLKQVTDFISQNTQVLTILLGAVAAVSGIILAANIALKAYEAAMVLVKVATVAWTGVQWLLNAALNGNPIGIIAGDRGRAAVVAIKPPRSCETFGTWSTSQAAIKVGTSLPHPPRDPIRRSRLHSAAKAAIESPIGWLRSGRSRTPQRMLDAVGIRNVPLRIAS
jgi:hypothetical protein